METDLTELINEVSNIYELYKNDEYMKNKVINTIKNMRSSLINIEDDREKREQRKKNLQDDTDLFVKKFLNNTKYFYNATSEIFFEYNNLNYYIIKEDDIQYKILSSVSNNKHLMAWKYKIKNNILKKIKETELFNSIPETETIQNIITSLTTNIFTHKEYTKYFLTIIGDIILKKKNNLYFVSSQLKPFIKEIHDQCYLLFGIMHLHNNFRYKFHDQDFNECRLVKIRNECSFLLDINILNLFCVAVYHSNRYINGDNYLQLHCKDEKIVNHILYLKNNNLSTIMKNFTDNMIEKSNENHKLKWTEILYLWKLYIEEQEIPNVCFSSVLKEYFIKEYPDDYIADPDIFINVTSPYLPNIIAFNDFWKDNIIEDTGNELEIDELQHLFKKHTSNIQLSEKKLLNLIKHYYPDVLIEDNKYLINISCNLWNKHENIKTFINEISENENYNKDEFSFDTLYNLYVKKKYNMIVSKRYFEKFISIEYVNYLIDSNSICFEN